jgi:general secretion pathway protein E
MVVAEFNQMQVQTNIDLTFAAGVRTLLRQDPDIIMVGEIRDLATAEMAVQASLTGHLVLSTLHTNDAPEHGDAPDGPRRAALPDPVHARGRGGAAPGAPALHALPRARGAGRAQVALPDGGEHVQFTGRAMRAVGCEECRKTGFYGRTAIYEMLPISENLRRMILPNLDMAQFRKAAMAEGLRPLNLSAAEQVARGVTTIEEALSVLPPV